MGETALRSVGPLHGTVSDTGYALPEGLSYEEWASEGPTLIAMARASMWWLGDWLVWGEFHFGEKYAQAVDATGLAVQTLKNAQWVADRIPPRERRADVPFSHHRAVASLEKSPRGDLLRAAAAEHLSEYEVRVRVRESKALAAGAVPDVPVRARSLAEILADARARLDAALDTHDWSEVATARQLVDEAATLCGLRAETRR